MLVIQQRNWSILRHFQRPLSFLPCLHSCLYCSHVRFPNTGLPKAKHSGPSRHDTGCWHAGSLLIRTIVYTVGTQCWSLHYDVSSYFLAELSQSDHMSKKHRWAEMSQERQLCVCRWSSGREQWRAEGRSLHRLSTNPRRCHWPPHCIESCVKRRPWIPSPWKSHAGPVSWNPASPSQGTVNCPHILSLQPHSWLLSGGKGCVLCRRHYWMEGKDLSSFLSIQCGLWLKAFFFFFLFLFIFSYEFPSLLVRHQGHMPSLFWSLGRPPQAAGESTSSLASSNLFPDCSLCSRQALCRACLCSPHKGSCQHWRLFSGWRGGGSCFSKAQSDAFFVLLAAFRPVTHKCMQGITYS